MNLFNGRLAKPLIEWCCERGQRDGVEVCVDCRQSLEDWRAHRRGDLITPGHEKSNEGITGSHEAPACVDGCQYAKDVAMPGHSCAGNCQYERHPIFTEAQLNKLATANALDEHFRIERYKK